MKKLTKTQKQNLKKKLLRTFNIIGLIVGGLSFIVVLYAIIAGGLAANNSEATTADISEVSPSKPTLEQRALTPPSSYDLELSSEIVGPHSYYFWQSSEIPYSEMLMTKYTDNLDYYINIHTWRGLTINTTIYAPTTPIEARPLDFFVFRGDYFGSAASSPAFRRFFITLNNYSSQAFIFYGDFSSSGYNVIAYTFLRDNGNTSVNYEISPTTFYYSSLSRALYIPPFSRISLYFSEVSTAQYLNALYIDDIGSTAYNAGYETGYDAGEGIGYNDGYSDGYGNGRDIGEGVGYNVGYDVGYTDGIAATTATTDAVENAFDLIYAGAQSVDKILSISIFGSITLGMLLFTPLIVGISLAVIKVIKG